MQQVYFSQRPKYRSFGWLSDKTTSPCWVLGKIVREERVWSKIGILRLFCPWTLPAWQYRDIGRYWAATKTGGPDNYHRRDNVIFFIIIHLQYNYFGHDNVMQILAEHIVIQIVIVERKEEMGRISILYFWLIFYFVFIMKSPRF